MESAQAYKLINLITDTLPVMEDIDEAIYPVFANWIAYKALTDKDAKPEEFIDRISLVEVVGIDEKNIIIQHTLIGNDVTQGFISTHSLPYEFLIHGEQMLKQAKESISAQSPQNNEELDLAREATLRSITYLQGALNTAKADLRLIEEQQK